MNKLTRISILTFFFCLIFNYSHSQTYADSLKIAYKTCTDNGKGFDGTKSVNNHKSLAMTITKERLVGYTKDKDFNVQTDNVVNTDGSIGGAKVVFEIPYIYEN